MAILSDAARPPPVNPSSSSPSLSGDLRSAASGAATTLTAALDAAARRSTGVRLYGLRGETIASLPYTDLRARARDLAGRLLGAGLLRGERVGLVAETSEAFICAFFACQYAGLIPAPLPLPAPLGGLDAYVEQIARLLAQAGAAAAFGPAVLAPQLAIAGARAGVRLLTPLDELGPGEGRLAAPEPTDACYIQFSSGSTRTPTGVLVTHQALMANIWAITRHGLKVGATDRALSWLPLFHDMGLVGFLLSPLAVAMPVDLMPTDAFVRRPMLWPRLISETGATISYSPSFGYELCARRAGPADLAGLDLSRWRVAGVGGDMVRPAPLTAFTERFAGAGFSDRAFVASYGMAEATLALTMAPLGDGLRRHSVSLDRLEQLGEAAPASAGERVRELVSCGPVLAGHALEVRDDHGAPLPDERVGKIFVRGPSLMQGYFEHPEATRGVLDARGWLDTGDLGFLSDGELFPTGRSKDLILLNGRNIWPQDLEWTLEAEIEGLRSGDVAAFAALDDHGGVVALVQTRLRDPQAQAKLAGDVAALLRVRHGVEAQVRLARAGALPRTSSGKLRRARARELYLAGAFEAARA